MKFYCYICCGLLCLLIAGSSPVLSQSLTAHQINLPGSFNRDLLQMANDEEGFIWFSNNEGIWRFDGTDIKLFDYKKLKLPQSISAHFLFCYDHFIFFCLNNGELHIYNKSTDECQVYSLSGWIKDLNKLPDGKLLFLTADGQAWIFTALAGLKKGFDLNSYKGWEKGMNINRTLVDKEGNIYIFLWDRVGQVMGDSILWSSVIQLPPNKGEGGFVITSATVTSRFIAAHYFAGEIVIYDKKTMNPVYFCAEHQFAACLSVNDELILIPHNDNEYSTCPVSPFFKVQKGVFSESSKIFCVVPCKDGRFLLGTTTGIVELKLHDTGLKEFYDQQKLVSFFSNKSVRSIYRLDDKLYVGTYSGLFVCSSDGIKPIVNGWAYTLQKESAHRLLAGVEGGTGFGMIDCQRDIFSTIPRSRTGSEIYTTALYRDNDQWISGDYISIRRLWQKDGEWHVEKILKDSSQGTFRQISRINGSLYIAGQKGVYKMDANNSLHKVYPEKDSLLVYCMLEVSDGIWLGTHGNGLVKIDVQGKILQQLGFNEGLTSNFVYSLARMKNLMVAGTGAGVNIFDIAGSALPFAINQDEKQNGFVWEECNHSAIFNDTMAGRVILGGVKGLIFVDSRDYGLRPENGNDLLTLAYVKTGGYETQSAEADLFAYLSDKIHIHPGDFNLVLKFAAPGNPEQQEGLFRIKELSENWQRTKLSQEVNLYALPPGKYTLEARLPFSLNDKTWFSKTLIIEPAFYQTLWFKFVLLLLCLLVVYLVWRSKVKKMEREQQLRTTIARDLHDDIGSTLNSISVYTEIAKQQLQGNSEKTTILLEKMGIASRNMIDKMSDIVWAINPKNDDFEQVLQKMQFFAGELLSGKNILLNFHADEKAKKLKFKMQERKNIYLIYKEAINNAYKYAEGKNVKVNIGKEGNSLVLLIEDDGKGFNLEEKSNSGNGLANMKNRAREIGAKLTMESGETGGTRILFRLRLSNGQ
jgi:signal transduction histidine kinase/ligand-binding sensor domain-containing protein